MNTSNKPFNPYLERIGFSRVKRIGNFISVSGTAPINQDNSTAYPNHLYNQTKTCIEIMKKAIEEAGGRIENVVRTRVYLKDISEWEKVAKAHGEFFSEIKPACTFVEVSGFIKQHKFILDKIQRLVHTFEYSLPFGRFSA